MEAVEQFRALLKQHQRVGFVPIGGCICYSLQMAFELREQEVKQAEKRHLPAGTHLSHLESSHARFRPSLAHACAVSLSSSTDCLGVAGAGGKSG